MLLDNENIVTESAGVIDESADEALSGIYEECLESYIGLEEAFGAMQVDQCIDEFKLFKKNGGKTDPEAAPAEGNGESKPGIKGTAKAYAAKAAAWFKKVWNAIKAFWVKVTNKLRSWFMTSEKFYAANKTAISTGAGKVTGFKGYKYGSIISIANKVQELANSTKKTLTSFIGKRTGKYSDIKAGNFDSALGDLRTKLCGSADAKGFKANLIAKYRGTAKVELKAADFQFSDLANASATNKSIAVASKSCDLLMQDIVIKVGASDGSTSQIAYLKQAVQIFHQAMGVCGSLMASSLAQTKAFAVAAITAAGGKVSSKAAEAGAKNESAEYEDGEQLFESDSEWTHYMQECGIEPIE